MPAVGRRKSSMRRCRLCHLAVRIATVGTSGTPAGRVEGERHLHYEPRRNPPFHECRETSRVVWAPRAGHLRVTRRPSGVGAPPGRPEDHLANTFAVWSADGGQHGASVVVQWRFGGRFGRVADQPRIAVPEWSATRAGGAATRAGGTITRAGGGPTPCPPCAGRRRARRARVANRGHHDVMTRLPARTGADVHLADAFAAPGCPLCRERARADAGYLESILAESVNDVTFRRELDEGRGLCPDHCRAFLVADRRRAGSLGASILLRATLTARLRDLEAVHAAGRRSRARRSLEAGSPPACPACRRLSQHDEAAVEGLVGLAENPTWAEAVSAAQFCLDHLVALVDRRTVPPWWPAIEGRQLDRLRDLRDRLDRFAHASAHDRRHLQTDDQRASVDEAADLLGGSGG